MVSPSCQYPSLGFTSVGTESYLKRGLLMPSGDFKAQSLGIAQWICGEGNRDACSQGPGKEHGQQEMPLGVQRRVLAEVEGRAVAGPMALSP